MAGASLAAQYRPQTFAELVGQDMVKSILSRASREDRVAPAYLLSGTRGVGKTTVARIFAKALNCAQAPTAEPCNRCDACRRITLGSFVDVVEIDGASNRGIDDVRRLRDSVGYAALEGRYKVFIIDEAHMLTKEAFNALLKTLEEPPAHVTFIMATTEQHKFPVTIVSRCQHFVFRQIPEARLEEHVASVLRREGRPFEPEAARLIARRAAGSVRDAMSLLDQTLALAVAEGERAALSAEQARAVLGLAGNEALYALMDHLARKDAAGIASLVRDLLDRGVDMGFFLRELGSLWRNMFLLRQLGLCDPHGPQGSQGSQAQTREAARAAQLLHAMPENEARALAVMAGRFSLTYIHAAWQMTLDGQRRILTSLEPAAGLELLLLNLAMLPRLLPLAELAPEALHAAPAASEEGFSPGEPRPEPAPASLKTPLAAGADFPSGESSSPTEIVIQGRGCGERSAPCSLVRLTDDFPQIPSIPQTLLRNVCGSGGAEDSGSLKRLVSPPESLPDASPEAPPDPDGPLRWESLLELNSRRENDQIPNLQQFHASLQGEDLVLRADSLIMFHQIQREPLKSRLEALIGEWAGRALKLEFLPPDKILRSEKEIRAELESHPTVQALQRHYDALILRCIDLGGQDGNHNP